ncbi:MAG: dipeptidase Metallo peptidase family [Blastococcus sp.]|nr:dipeptidase Metallo peptidase family [Blastococcus sp.]
MTAVPGGDGLPASSGLPTTATADCHNDLLLGVLHQRERGLHDPFGDFWLPQLRAGGLVLQVLPIFTEEQYVGEAALRRTLLLLEEARRIAGMHSADVAICETGDDIRAALASGRIALVLAIEGAEPVGNNLAILDTLFRLGVRMLSLAWNRRTMLADGAAENATGGRLTRLGIDAVQEMERLGLVVDVSHLSEAGFDHVREIATRPFVASHSSCRALQDHPRNLRDAEITAIADAGGFVGINSFGPFLAEQPTLADFVEHIAHACAVAGAEHVGLGPDFMLDLCETMDPNLGGTLVDLSTLPWVAELVRPADLARLGPAVVERLGEEAARAVMAGTIVDTLVELLPASAPRAVPDTMRG